FAAEIVPVQVPDPRRRGETVTFAVDEHPRRDTSLEQLARLRPVFREGGTVTAGNSAGVNDGAAAVVVMGADTAQRLGLKPRLRLVASAMAGIDPAYMGYAPTYAIPRVLKRAGLTLDDMDVVELNEAFAALVLAVIRDGGLEHVRSHPGVGAHALGLPGGATAFSRGVAVVL